MPANTAPIFTLTPVVKTAAIASTDVANTTRDATNGTIVTVLSAGTNGTRIERITATGTLQTAAAQVILYLFDGTTNWFLKELILSPGILATTTVAASTLEWVRTDGLALFNIPNGWSLKAGITVVPTSGKVNITAFGGDY